MPIAADVVLVRERDRLLARDALVRVVGRAVQDRSHPGDDSENENGAPDGNARDGVRRPVEDLRHSEGREFTRSSLRVSCPPGERPAPRIRRAVASVTRARRGAARNVRVRPRPARGGSRVAPRDAARVVVPLDGDGRAGVRRVVGASRGGQLGRRPGLPRVLQLAAGVRPPGDAGSAGTRRTRTTPGRSIPTASRSSGSSSARRSCRRACCRCCSPASPRPFLRRQFKESEKIFLERVRGKRRRAAVACSVPRRGVRSPRASCTDATARSSSTISFSTATDPSHISRPFSSPCRLSRGGGPKSTRRFLRVEIAGDRCARRGAPSRSACSAAPRPS